MMNMISELVKTKKKVQEEKTFEDFTANDIDHRMHGPAGCLSTEWKVWCCGTNFSRRKAVSLYNVLVLMNRKEIAKNMISSPQNHTSCLQWWEGCSNAKVCLTYHWWSFICKVATCFDHWYIRPDRSFLWTQMCCWKSMRVDCHELQLKWKWIWIH